MPERDKCSNEILPCLQECSSRTVLDYCCASTWISPLEPDFSLVEASSPHIFQESGWSMTATSACIYRKYGTEVFRILIWTHRIWIMCCLSVLFRKNLRAPLQQRRVLVSQGGFTLTTQVGLAWLFELCLLIFLFSTASKQSQAQYSRTFLYRTSETLPRYQIPEWHLPTLMPDYA